MREPISTPKYKRTVPVRPGTRKKEVTILAHRAAPPGDRVLYRGEALIKRGDVAIRARVRALLSSSRNDPVNGVIEVCDGHSRAQLARWMEQESSIDYITMNTGRSGILQLLHCSLRRAPFFGFGFVGDGGWERWDDGNSEISSAI